MLTTDLSLRFDPIYGPISKRFHEHPEELADAFARAWFKLTHRDMGPIERYLGPEVPSERLLWQDPVPEVDHELIGAEDVAELKRQILDSGLSVSAAGLGRVGVGVDVPRQRQARRRQRGAHPARAAEGLGGQRARRSWRRCCSTLEGIQARLRQAGLARRPDRARRLRRRRAGGAGTRGVERRGAVHAGAHGRVAGVDRRGVLRPRSSRPRTGSATTSAGEHRLPAEYLLVDRANLLTLSAPEMTVLVGGLRVLGANYKGSSLGVLTSTAGVADQRLLREPARRWARSGRRRPTASTRAATPPRATSGGPAAASTSSSARTPSCARSRRSTRATTRGRSSCATSSRRGSRS